VARLAERGRRPAALFIDSLFTSAGIFTPDAAVVAATLQAARDAGALLVADEVQSGHGRSGDGLWRFPAWGVTPDVVTLGKPMGNGHPIAAVVTRGALADCMAEAKTAFFSTFGGNPVACAAALTVLDVLEDERLVENAAEVGDWLQGALIDLAGRHPAIGDVRGRGLMIGIELVRDRATKEPADIERDEVEVECFRRGLVIQGCGTSTIRLSPPLVIDRDQCDYALKTLDEALAAVAPP
jgi:4-aminobutyrate aminotransferase-like enzyme